MFISKNLAEMINYRINFIFIFIKFHFDPNSLKFTNIILPTLRKSQYHLFFCIFWIFDINTSKRFKNIKKTKKIDNYKS